MGMKNKAHARALIEKMKLLIQFSAAFFNGSLFVWTENEDNTDLARKFLAYIYGDRNLA